MNIAFTIVTALPIGLLVRQRAAAVLAFVLADLFVFIVQTLDVLLNWMSGAAGIGGEHAFGPSPDAMPIKYTESEVFAYGLVNLLIITAGIGLVVLGHRIRARRTKAKSVVTVG